MQKNVVMLRDILTWASYFAERVVPEKCQDAARVFQSDPTLNDKVSLWQGDITVLEVDAIVNAANNGLLGGGGVDACIHQAAGEGLLEECRTLNGCPDGEAKLTKGYKLPAKHVIHAVGPQAQDCDLLESAYKNSYSVAATNGIKSIAFPCISTGVFGFPREEAAHVALRTSRHFLEENKDKIDRIIFVPYLEEDVKIYERLMQRYFPIPLGTGRQEL